MDIYPLILVMEYLLSIEFGDVWQVPNGLGLDESVFNRDSLKSSRPIADLWVDFFVRFFKCRKRWRGLDWFHLEADQRRYHHLICNLYIFYLRIRNLTQ